MLTNAIGQVTVKYDSQTLNAFDSFYSIHNLRSEKPKDKTYTLGYGGPMFELKLEIGRAHV